MFLVAFSIISLTILMVHLAQSEIAPPGQCIQPRNVFSVQKPTVQCCTQGFLGAPHSQCFFSDSIESCRQIGGAVQGCGVHGIQAAPTYDIKNITQYYNATDIENDAILANLTEAIRRAGVFNGKYNKTSYNCVNFSSDLERNLTAMGFDATVTILSWGHAVTDVHIGPYTIFVEPQVNASIRGTPENYTYTVPYGSLDYERRNDSTIGVLIAPNPYPNKTIKTEGNVMISIYDNMSQAISSGVKPGK